eukprot:2229025-Alexandrium_andersonii.AAC.1
MAKGPPSWRVARGPDHGPRPQQGDTCSRAGRYLPSAGLAAQGDLARLAAGVAPYTCSRSPHARPRPEASESGATAAQASNGHGRRGGATSHDCATKQRPRPRQGDTCA